MKINYVAIPVISGNPIILDGINEQLNKLCDVVSEEMKTNGGLIAFFSLEHDESLCFYFDYEAKRLYGDLNSDLGFRYLSMNYEAFKEYRVRFINSKISPLDEQMDRP